MSLKVDGATIDRALGNEPPLEPSAYFAARVMRSVRDDVDAREAIGVPWGRFALGVSLGAAAVALSAVAPTGPAPAPEVLDALQWMTLSLVGTLAIAVGSYRLLGRT